jgi:hypothetical protein
LPRSFTFFILLITAVIFGALSSNHGQAVGLAQKLAASPVTGDRIALTNRASLQDAVGHQEAVDGKLSCSHT